MNEDDTFRRLKRIPYMELYKLVNLEIIFQYDKILQPFTPMQIDWLNKYGWTELEYKKEARNHLFTNIIGVSWITLLDHEIERLEKVEKFNDRG